MNEMNEWMNEWNVKWNEMKWNEMNEMNAKIVFLVHNKNPQWSMVNIISVYLKIMLVNVSKILIIQSDWGNDWIVCFS